MKIYAFFCFLGLTTHSYAFSQNEKDIMSTIGYVQFFILENVILMGGYNCSTEISPTIRRAKKEAITCIENVSVPGSFCASLRNDWFKCLEPLAKKLEKCNGNIVLEGAIDLSIRTTLLQADFVCNSQTSDLFELANPCFLKSLESEEPCVNRFVIDVQSVFITQKKLVDEFCRASSELESCVTSTIEDNCPNNITINTLKGIYNATVKPCKKNNKDIFN